MLYSVYVRVFMCDRYANGIRGKVYTQVKNNVSVYFQLRSSFTARLKKTLYVNR